MPTVSILIPTYNHENFITAALDSCKGQKVPLTELLILDDGSCDRTFELAEAWIKDNQEGFSRIKLWKQENKGLCATLNTLIESAQGKYLALLASDDLLVENSLRCRVEFLEARPDLWAVFGDSIPIDEAGAELAESSLTGLGIHSNKRALADPGLLPFELIQRWSGSGPVFMVMKEAFDPVLGVGLYDETLYFEDRDMYLRLIARKKLAFIDSVVAKYRCRPQSMSRSMDSQNRMQDGMRRSNRKAMKYFSGFLKCILALWVFSEDFRYVRRPRIFWYPIGTLAAICRKSIFILYNLYLKANRRYRS